MVDNVEDHTLRLLQDIWQSVNGLREILNDHGGRLNRIEQRIDEVHETMYQVAGFAMHANVRHDTVTERLKVLEERVGRLEEKA
jgi:hypothetical protein